MHGKFNLWSIQQHQLGQMVRCTCSDEKDKKKIVVDIYTDWCGWCKRMDASTFQDPKVIKAINKNFYAVKFNAEQKEDINFKSKVYQFVPQGNRGYHSLAAEITQGRLSYPTFVFR